MKNTMTRARDDDAAPAKRTLSQLRRWMKTRCWRATATRVDGGCYKPDAQRRSSSVFTVWGAHLLTATYIFFTIKHGL